MPATVEKFVRGKKLTQAEWRRYIRAFIHAGGEDGVTLPDILEHLGPGWAEPMNANLVSQFLNYEVRKGHIQRPRRGVYVLPRSPDRVSVAELHEHELTVILRKLGGYAFWRDIAREVDADWSVKKAGKRPMEPILRLYGDEDPDEEAEARALHEAAMAKYERALDKWKERHPAYDGYNRSLRRILRESPRFRQDFMIRGLYALPAAERAALPLRGVFAAAEFRGAAQARDKSMIADPEPIWDAQRVFFKGVGAAFQFARTLANQSLRELAAEPTIAPVLEDLAEGAEIWHGRTIQAFEDAELLELEERLQERIHFNRLEHREARAAGREKFRARTLLEVLAAFEDGDPSVHIAAPLSFYTTLAAHWDLDAAALSRGVYQQAESAEVIRVRPAREPDFVRDQRQAEEEAAVEANRRAVEAI